MNESTYRYTQRVTGLKDGGWMDVFVLPETANYSVNANYYY